MGKDFYKNKATTGLEPVNRGFANHCLTTWLRRPKWQRQANLPAVFFYY